MGHDIAGYNNRKEEVAYIGYGASDENAWIVYNVLNVENFDLGVSGNGKCKNFNKEKIELAIELLASISDSDYCYKNRDGLEYERRKINSFLEKCKTVADEEGNIIIFFR